MRNKFEAKLWRSILFVTPVFVLVVFYALLGQQTEQKKISVAVRRRNKVVGGMLKLIYPLPNSNTLLRNLIHPWLKSSNVLLVKLPESPIASGNP